MVAPGNDPGEGCVLVGLCDADFPAAGSPVAVAVAGVVRCLAGLPRFPLLPAVAASDVDAGRQYLEQEATDLRRARVDASPLQDVEEMHPDSLVEPVFQVPLDFH